MAAARDHAIAEPNTMVSVTEYADPGIQCCWCDCPLDVHKTPDYQCDGCPSDAVYMVRVITEAPGDRTYPMCERQRWGLAQLYQEAADQLGIPIPPIEIFAYDAYDKDMSR